MIRSSLVLTGAAVAVLAGPTLAETSTPELRMIHTQRKSITQGTDVFGVFTPNGPQLGTLMPAPRRLDYVTWDPANDTWFGQQTSSIGTIDPSGAYTEVELPETVKLSHSGGLAFDTANQAVIVGSKSGAGMKVFSYALADGTWTEVGNFGREPLQGLACDGAQGLFYTLEKSRDGEHCAQMHVHNAHGARVATHPLSSPIPFVSALNARVQLSFEDGALYALTSHHEHPRMANAMWRIDANTGHVVREAYNADVDLTSQTWPGWDGGPAASSPMAATGARGDGDYSNYQTPPSLLSGQEGELHVIAVGTGAINHLDWLKKVRSVKATAGEAGVSIAVEMNPDAETQPPVVEVVVGATQKPVTIALLAESPVTWSIDAADANLERVVTFTRPYMNDSSVIGVDPSLVVSGGNASGAYAWELHRSSVAVGFDEMIEAVRAATGLRENSFQGLSHAEAFRVPVASDVEVTSVPTEE